MKLCVDLGATNIKVGLIEGGAVIRSASRPTVTDCGREGVVSSLKNAIDCLYHGAEDAVSAICISSAGTIDVKTGTVIYATDNLPGYTGFCITDWVKQTYGLPSVAVNDGHAALLGELLLSEEYRTERVAMLTLGSGVGGAYAEYGELVANEQNNYALFGHLPIAEGGIPCNCGRIGCMEQYLSGRAINRLAAEHGIKKDTVFDLFLQGDAAAARVVERLKGYLLRAIEAVSAVNPFDTLILGGGAADGMGEAFSYFAEGMPCKVRKARAGNAAGMLGAYYLGRNL